MQQVPPRRLRLAIRQNPVLDPKPGAASEVSPNGGPPSRFLARLFAQCSQFARRLIGIQPQPPWRLEEQRAPDVVLPPPTTYRRLESIVLTDEVSRTLFEEYAEHRKGPRGREETGWLLLGHRLESEAIVLATLPAGAQRDAGVAHVRFDSTVQELGSLLVRQKDKRLTILGVVHTHPGSLRHPSSGDFEGDSVWVRHLRGREGVFGIGTADSGSTTPGTGVATQPKPSMQCLGPLRFSWYTLREGDRQYQPMPVRLTLGPDLARPLHDVWSILEAHADPLDRLCLELAKIRCDVLSRPEGAVLAIRIRLAQPGDYLQIVLGPKNAEYTYVRAGEPLRVELENEPLDRAVYLFLAELAQAAASHSHKKE